jgi:hypothetical protein
MINKLTNNSINNSISADSPAAKSQPSQTETSKELQRQNPIVASGIATEAKSMLGLEGDIRRQSLQGWAADGKITMSEVFDWAITDSE